MHGPSVATHVPVFDICQMFSHTGSTLAHGKAWKQVFSSKTRETSIGTDLLVDQAAAARWTETHCQHHALLHWRE